MTIFDSIYHGSISEGKQTSTFLDMDSLSGLWGGHLQNWNTGNAYMVGTISFGSSNYGGGRWTNLLPLSAPAIILWLAKRWEMQ